MDRQIIRNSLTVDVGINNWRKGQAVGWWLRCRAVASEIRGLWFESSHRQNFIMKTSTVSCRKIKNQKSLEMTHFYKQW